MRHDEIMRRISLIFISNSQIAAAALLNFKRLKQGFEIAFAKALTSAAANDFKEHGGAVLQWLGE